MPSGSYQIDPAATFTSVLLMASGPRLKFGESTQDVTRNGELRWDITVAVTFKTEPGMRVQSEVLQIGINGGSSDPAAAIAPGTSVDLIDLRLGVSTPEQRTNDRGSRVVGGKPWFQCSAIRAASPASNGSRPLASAGAKSEG